MTQYLIGRIKTLKLPEIISNLGKNWFIPLSALCFFLSNTGLQVEFYYSAFTAFVLILLLSAVCPPFGSFFSETSLKHRIIALFSSLGICLCTWDILKYKPLFSLENAFLIRSVLVILALPFVFAVNLLFWKKIEGVIGTLIGKAEIKKAEWIVYLILFLIYGIFVAFSFMRTNAFYDTDLKLDVIYTSDSSALVENNAFILIDNVENDVRQPLFAVLSAPLLGIPGLIGSVLHKIIPSIPSVLIIDYGQIILLLAAALILAVELKLNWIQRICFVLIFSSTYTFLLFSLMMEQYVVAFFWLVMTIHFMINDSKEAWIFSYASTGTLLTSGVLVPFFLLRGEKGMEAVIKFVERLVIYGIEFVVLMLISGRLNLIMNFWNNVGVLSLFTGRSVGYGARVLQYFSFIAGVFYAPGSLEVHYDGYYGDYNTWQLAEVSTLNIAGLIIFALALAGFIISRKEKISQISLGWIGFSVILLILVGWGTAENGLVLYSLYFGWPFFVLIFRLIRAVEEKCRVKWIIPALSFAVIVFLLFHNIPATADMLSFAVREFPV